jgi:hypothetical protein
MSIGMTSASLVRRALGVLLAFGAINAFAGGYYGLSGAKGVPLEWLDGSPFANYFIPSLLLLIVVGGSFVTAAVAVFARFRMARPAALVAVVIMTGWLAAQIAIIGYVSWMQPTTAVATFAIFLLAWILPSPPARPAACDRERGIGASPEHSAHS